MSINKDTEYLDRNIKGFKESFFQLISDFGPTYTANFMLLFDDIKQNTDRERLTDVTLNSYEDYLQNHGFKTQRTPTSIMLTLDAYHIVTVGNEAMDLSNALKVFRDRAIMKGDMDNMYIPAEPSEKAH